MQCRTLSSLLSSLLLSTAAISADCIVKDPDISANYSGECKDGLASKKGRASGRDKYVGEFLEGMKHGKGIYEWAVGVRYEGDYVSDRRNGFGIMTIPRSVYTKEAASGKGEWRGDIYVQQGLYRNGAHILQCSDRTACEQRQAADEQKKYKRLACVTWEVEYSTNPIFKNADIAKFEVSGNIMDRSDDQCEVKIKSQKRTSFIFGESPYKNNENIVIECSKLSSCK